MTSPANVRCPCDGDAFQTRRWPVERVSCDWCQHYHMNVPGAAMGSCLGPEGWPILAHTAAEVALERATGPSVTGGTVTNITLYPAGTDSRLVQGQEATR